MLSAVSSLVMAFAPLWGTADTAADNPELRNTLHVKPGIGQNIAMHVLPTARNLLYWSHFCHVRFKVKMTSCQCSNASVKHGLFGPPTDP